MLSIAPNLIMPAEKDRQDLEVDFGQTQEDPGIINSSRMGGRIGARIGGLGDQDGDVPPDDLEGNHDNLDHDEENKQGENMYNVEDEHDQKIDGQINHLMMQGSIAQKGVKSMGQVKANDATNKLISLTERRPGTLDPYELSYQLVYDINIVSTQVFSLWYKLIEIITINPKFVCEFLRVAHEEKMREYWGELIYRTVFETINLAGPSSKGNVQEIHKQIAIKRRQLNKTDDENMIRNTVTELSVIEISD